MNETRHATSDNANMIDKPERSAFSLVRASRGTPAALSFFCAEFSGDSGRSSRAPRGARDGRRIGPDAPGFTMEGVAT